MSETEEHEEIIILQQSLEKISEFLDSNAYWEMVEDPDNSDETRKSLKKCWKLRNKLVSALLTLYAKNIRSNNADFEKLTEQMTQARRNSEEAADGLKKTADRIEAAVQMAKAVDAALNIAAELAP